MLDFDHVGVSVADLYAAYETVKRRRRWLDFDDLLADCARAAGDIRRAVPQAGDD